MWIVRRHLPEDKHRPDHCARSIPLPSPSFFEALFWLCSTEHCARCTHWHCRCCHHRLPCQGSSLSPSSVCYPLFFFAPLGHKLSLRPSLTISEQIFCLHQPCHGPALSQQRSSVGCNPHASQPMVIFALVHNCS